MRAMILRESLQTVQLVPVTPFDERGDLALPSFEKLIARLSLAGIRVFIPGAGTGEFHSLADDEIVALVTTAKKALTAGPSPRDGERGAVIMAPLGGSVERAVALARRTADAGADCGLVMPLEFPYLCDAAARDYLQALLDRAPFPLLVYKKAEFPSADLLIDLAKHPLLLGVKYAVNDLDAFQCAVRKAAARNEGQRLEWYCGSAERYAPYFALAGAVGYTSGAGVVCPRITLAMHAALAAGRWSDAMRFQQQLLPIEQFRARCGSSYNISFLKHAVKCTGIDCGDPRPGQRRLTAAEKQEIEALLVPILAAERELA